MHFVVLMNWLAHDKLMADSSKYLYEILPYKYKKRGSRVGMAAEFGGFHSKFRGRTI